MKLKQKGIMILVVLGFSSCTGLSSKQPQEVGDAKVTKLASCNEDKSNCVSSDATSPYHSMKVWKVKKHLNSLAPLGEIISQDPQAKIIIQHDHYIYAQYQSRFLKFIDDVEFLLQSNGLIHFRSSSRLGRKDFGVNRKRIEHLEQQFKDFLDEHENQSN